MVRAIPFVGSIVGGGTPHMKGLGCSSEILDYKTSKGERSGRGPTFF